jgi:hypothetical protein
VPDLAQYSSGTLAAPLGDWLHADYASINLPHLNDTVVEPPFCLLDCRTIIGAIYNGRWSGYVIVRSQLINPVRRHRDTLDLKQIFSQ